MFKYEGCGLPNVWLLDGYKIIETAYGRAVSIENIESLHKAIGLHLVGLPRRLTGSELRFLRKELNLSQKHLGNIVGRDPQSIAIWEKTDGKLPKSAIGAENFVRVLFSEHVIGNVNVKRFLDELCDLNNHEDNEEIAFHCNEYDEWSPREYESLQA